MWTPRARALSAAADPAVGLTPRGADLGTGLPGKRVDLGPGSLREGALTPQPLGSGHFLL